MGVELYALPITTPRTPCPDWLRWELENRFDFNRVPLKSADIDQLIEVLAPGPARPDGLPAYLPHAWRFHRYETQTGRRGTWVRRVAAAVAYDLGGYEMVEVSAKVLGLHDHELPGSGVPKKAREFRRFGRRLLALLGCWPWAHVDSGKLPRNWRTDAPVLAAFAAWHTRVCGEREAELAHCRWAFREGHRLPRQQALTVPPEATPPTQPPTRRHPDERVAAQTPERPLTNAEARQREADLAGFDALVEEHDRRLQARAQARKDRRPVEDPPRSSPTDD